MFSARSFLLSFGSPTLAFGFCPTDTGGGWEEGEMGLGLGPTSGFRWTCWSWDSELLCGPRTSPLCLLNYCVSFQPLISCDSQGGATRTSIRLNVRAGSRRRRQERAEALCGPGPPVIQGRSVYVQGCPKQSRRPFEEPLLKHTDAEGHLRMQQQAKPGPPPPATGHH